MDKVELEILIPFDRFIEGDKVCLPLKTSKELIADGYAKEATETQTTKKRAKKEIT
jgi:hypothetical protein